ncbi:hypothetical protein HZP59_08610 [Elizabethkingia anophelis]|nr:hypothetical protein [Elizabethkingia anophelis]
MNEITRQQYLDALDIVLKYRTQIKNDLILSNDIVPYTRDTLILDVHMSGRTRNCIKKEMNHLLPKNIDELTVKEFKDIIFKDGKWKLGNVRNLGKKSIEEIKAILEII